MPILFPTIPGNPHLRAIEARFGPLPSLPGQVLPGMRFVFICFTNRSGSNHLADALHSDGRLNLAGEFFNADAVADDVRQHGHASFADYVRMQIRWRQRGGRFVAKLAVPHLEVLGRAGILDAAAPAASYIHITRANRLGQAISLHIAEQTGQWTSDMPPARAPAYDRARIAAILDQIDQDTATLERFFTANAIDPIRVEYAAFVADPATHLTRIGTALGLPDLRLDPAALRYARQSGQLNRDWRARYLAG